MEAMRGTTRPAGSLHAIFGEAPRAPRPPSEGRGRAEPKTRSAVAMGMKPLQRLMDFLLTPPLTAPRSVLIMRLMAGGVFLSEGILV
jgi:hypothetical protein